tara:strand:- start:256 stop:693 length:438 start_codon:yes stop_codon:yes gene_type:complete
MSKTLLNFPTPQATVALLSLFVFFLLCLWLFVGCFELVESCWDGEQAGACAEGAGQHGKGLCGWPLPCQEGWKLASVALFRTHRQQQLTRFVLALWRRNAAQCYIDKLKDEPEFTEEIMDKIFLCVATGRGQERGQERLREVKGE